MKHKITSGVKMMMGLRKDIVAILIIIVIATLFCGCSQKETPIKNTTNATPIISPTITTNSIYGTVYVNGYATSDARIDAIAIDGTDHRSIVTNGSGVYVLTILQNTSYYVTATYLGMLHTIWPVYLPGEINIFDINLTTVPASTIEGTGYTMGGVSPYPTKYDYMKWSGVVINVTAVKDIATITALSDGDGDYSLDVKPNTLYNITGAMNLQNKNPQPEFHYRNYAGPNMGYINQIRVGSNETVLIDYTLRLP